MLPGGYTDQSLVHQATWLEALRDCCAHSYALSLEGRVVWDSNPLWRDFERIKWTIRGWHAYDISQSRKRVLRSLGRANRCFVQAMESKA